MYVRGYLPTPGDLTLSIIKLLYCQNADLTGRHLFLYSRRR